MTPAELEAVRRNYRTAFLRYLTSRAEAPLHDAYRIGRAALDLDLSVPDLVWIHHEILLEALADRTGTQPDAIAEAASEFLAEALSVIEMTRRGRPSPSSGARANGRGGGSTRTPRSD